MIQLGTDPFCIIFAKQYNWGLSPFVLFQQINDGLSLGGSDCGADGQA